MSQFRFPKLEAKSVQGVAISILKTTIPYFCLRRFCSSSFQERGISVALNANVFCNNVAMPATPFSHAV
jgi:hypothetical protein